jgi:hypothetical protein
VVKWPRLLFLAAAVALAAWAWVALHPSTERLVRRQLAGVAHSASFGPSQGTLAKLSSAESLADFFSTNVEIKIDVPGYQQHHLAGREEIQQAALAMRAWVKSLSVNFPDVNVTVNTDQQSAIADLTLQATVAGERDMIVQEMKVTLRKINGQWLIVKVETVRTLH